MQKGCLFALLLVVGLAVFAGLAFMSTYNGLVSNDERMAATAAQIDNMYERRADLIPQLVATVKGAADFEQSTLTELTEARASAGQIKLPENLTADPEGMQAYFAAQDKVGSALTRFFAVAEAYPQLGATAAFRDLQAQVEGSENRIAVARTDFITSVQTYNTQRRKFPGNVVAGMFGFEAVDQPEGDPASREAPVIDFGADG
jgi:LemA protein